MTTPRISIVTPSFNQGRFLEHTIRSILSQNYENLEYIVIDGGSTDESPRIIEKHASQLAFWCSESDGGHIDGVNKGFAKATGDVMAWLNSDDIYFPWTLQIVSGIMAAHPEIEWITTLRPATCDYHGLCVNVGRDHEGFSRDAFLDGCYLPRSGGQALDALGLYQVIQQESTFWRRSLWERVGGQLRTEFRLAADFDLWSRFYEHADLYATTAPLAGFRLQFAQKTSQWDMYVTDARKSLQLMRQRLGWSRSRLRFATVKHRLDHIPYLRRYVVPRCSYRGKRVVRSNPGRPEATWEIDDHTFWRSV